MKFGKIIPKKKEMPSKKTIKNYKNRSDTTSQPSSSRQTTQDPNQRKNNNERYDQFNNIQSKGFKFYHHKPYRKRFYRQKSSTYHCTHFQDRNYCY